MQDLKSEHDTKKRQYDALKAGLDSGRSTLESVCFLDGSVPISLLDRFHCYRKCVVSTKSNTRKSHAFTPSKRTC